jgi:hypothetical protein
MSGTLMRADGSQYKRGHGKQDSTLQELKLKTPIVGNGLQAYDRALSSQT